MARLSMMCSVLVSGAVWAQGSVSLAPISLDGASPAPAAAAAPAGQEGAVVKVKGKGSGETKAVALKAAYRDAVERAVGLFVDAEQQMKNEDVLNDQVLTQANGYVEGYEVTKESEANGLVTIQIAARVRRTALVKKLSGLMPVQNVALGGALQDLHAQIESKEARNRDGAALVANVLKDFDPMRQLASLSLASANPVVSEKKAEGGDGNVRIGYLFKLELDQKRYFDEFVPKMKQVLDQVALKSRTVRLVNKAGGLSFAKSYDKAREGYLAAGAKFESERGRADYPGYFDGLQVLEAPLGDGMGVRMGLATLSNFHAKTPAKDASDLENGVVVVLVTEANANGAKATAYTVDAATAAAINDWQKSMAGNGQRNSRPLRYEIVFKDANGGEVAAFNWNVGFSGYGMPMGYDGYCQFLNALYTPPSGRYVRENPKYIWFVSPYLRGAGERYVEWRAFEFAKDDLARIKSMAIELAE